MKTETYTCWTADDPETTTEINAYYAEMAAEAYAERLFWCCCECDARIVESLEIHVTGDGQTRVFTIRIENEPQFHASEIEDAT
jgi:hypothetical protein